MEGSSLGSLCLPPSVRLFSMQRTHCTSGHSYPDLIPNSPDPLPAFRCSQKEVKLPAQHSLCACPTPPTKPSPYTQGSSQSVGLLELDACPGSTARLVSVHSSYCGCAGSPWSITCCICPTPAQSWPEVMFSNAPVTQWTLSASFFLPYEHTPSFLYKTPMAHT